MIVLLPTRLHWIKDHPDNPHDLCAHSPVDFRVDGAVSDAEWFSAFISEWQELRADSGKLIADN